jgi:hypothetical protein
MKKISLFACLVFALSITLQYGVQAQQDQTDPQRLELEKRISERIGQQKINLDSIQKQRIKLRCVGAQTKAKVQLTNAKKFSEQNDKQFEEIIDKINQLIQKLAADGQDTAPIITALDKTKQQEAQLKTTYEKFISALSDTIELDCKTDPAGFKASLQESRAAFRDLVKLRVDVRKSIKEDVKNALKSIVIRTTN